MAAIHALLNPSTSIKHDQDQGIGRKQPPRLLSPISPSFLTDSSPSQTPCKKQKIVKDQPIFTRGSVRGQVRYPPFEYSDEKLSAHHQRFDMFPMEDLGAYPRHIPYNSEKKLFQNKTGRDFFEVFQYQFKMPGSEQQYTLLWDYNIGLVRTTPLFKCCGYGKTTPAKMLNRNVGLRDICHSITGGSLVAQGYWIPYEAAKAIAATFCWAIRYALTPVFGIDFVGMCIPPDSNKFGVMLIEEKLTQLCAEQAREYRQLELEDPTSRPNSAQRSPRTPTPSRDILTRCFRAVNDDTSSGCTSETSDNDCYKMSPTSPVPFRHPWSAANTPRSAPRPEDELLSPKSLIAHARAKRPSQRAVGLGAESSASTPAVSPAPHRSHRRVDFDEGYDGDNSESEADKPSHRCHVGGEGPKQGGFGEKEAAHVLMSLSGFKKGAKRRAST